MTLAIDNGFGALPTENQERPVGVGYGARVGDTWVRLAASPQTPLRYYTRDSLAQRQADVSNVYEQVLDIGYVFQRQDLSGGEGLDYFPSLFGRSNPELDETRFFDSVGINIEQPRRGDSFSLKLSREPETWYTPGAAPLDIAVAGGKLLVAEGDEVHEFDDWADSTPDNSQQLVAAQNVTMLDGDGAGNAVALLANGQLWYKPAGTSTWTQVTGSPAVDDIQAVWLVKDRIMVYKIDPTNSVPRDFGELSLAITGAAGSPTITPTYTSVDTFFANPTAVIDAGTAILVATDDGYIRSYVWQTDSAGTAPSLTVRARAPMPVGEYAYALGHNGGTLMILTIENEDDGANPIERLYRSEVLDERFDFIVGQLDFLREWNGALTPGFSDRMATSRNYIYWLMREADGDTYLWRYDIRTTGIVRHVEVTAAAAANRITLWRDRLVWFDSNSVDRIGDLYVDEGYLITPNINFGLNTDINWISTSIQAFNVLDGQGAQVELYISTDPDAIKDRNHASWQLAIRLSNAEVEEIEQPLTAISDRTAALMIVMYDNNVKAGTPEILRFGLRGLPKHRDWIVELPINVSDQIEVPGRLPYRIDGWGDIIHSGLLDMQGNHLQLEVLDPPLSFSGIIDNIVEPVEYIGERGSAGRVCLVQFRGTRVTSGETNPTGDAGVGLGLVGVSTLGIGQTGGLPTAGPPFDSGFDEGFE
jgi:hypothetical protein